eukprot:g2829.t1
MLSLPSVPAAIPPSCKYRHNFGAGVGTGAAVGYSVGTGAGVGDQSRQSLVDADVPDDFELSYPLLADYIFDRSALAKYVTAYAIILQQIGVGTIALTLFGDMLAPLVAADLPDDDRLGKPSTLILLAAGLVVFPLCQLQYLDSLRFASYIANALTFFLVVSLLGASCYELGHRPDDTRSW